jgi:integrase/recombinase XerD
MDQLESFLTYVSVEKGLSRNTIAAYSTDLRKFQEFLLLRDKDFVSFSRADIIDFIERLGNEGYSVSSICRIISSIKSLCKYLIIENVIKEDFQKHSVFLKSCPFSKLIHLLSTPVLPR